MEKQQEKKVTGRITHWLDIVETVTVVGSVGGAIASVVMQQAALASLPLSLSLALNLANRRRQLTAIETSQQERMGQVSEQVQIHHSAIARLLQQNKAYSVRFDQFFKQLEASQQLTSDLSDKILLLQQSNQDLGNQLEHLRNANSQSDLYYFEEGCAYQRKGNLQAALDNYTQALNLNPSYGDAYFNRGIVRSQVGDRQGAVADLRAAANFYFEQGNLASYQQAKDMSRQIHESMEAATSAHTEEPERIAVGSLFD